MTPTVAHSFRKQERLSRRSAIQQLFSNGRSFFSYPFKAVVSLALIPSEPYQVGPETPAAQVLFSVPKRTFKRATVRNRIRRRAREAYRKNHDLWSENRLNSPLHIAYIYVAKKEESYFQIEESLQKITREIIKSFGQPC